MAAFCFGIIVVLVINSPGYMIPVFFSAVAAALTGYISWFLLIEKNGRYRYLRAVSAGVITVILSHYTVFILRCLWNR